MSPRTSTGPAVENADAAAKGSNARGSLVPGLKTGTTCPMLPAEMPTFPRRSATTPNASSEPMAPGMPAPPLNAPPTVIATSPPPKLAIVPSAAW